MIDYERRVAYVKTCPEYVWIRKYEHFEEELSNHYITGWKACVYDNSFFKTEGKGMFFICGTKGEFKHIGVIYNKFLFNDPTDTFPNRCIEFNISANWVAIPIRNNSISRKLYKNYIVHEDKDYIYV